jgi:hypothetical protein
MDEARTIAVRLKCKLEYENAYAQGNVQPACVINALTELSKTPLYLKEKITINKDWESLFDNNRAPKQEDTCLDETLVESDEEPITESLIHWFNDPHSIKDLDTTIIEIAPSEGFRPLGIFQDTYSEEMNFPTLFYGSARPEHMKDKFSYQKIAKWELLHRDNDFATHITNIFFKAIKIIIHQISSLAWVCIRKAELRGQKLTAKDVRNPTNLERIIRSPLGFRSLKSICTSPDYLEHTKKNIFAMIR